MRLYIPHELCFDLSGEISIEPSGKTYDQVS